MNADAIRQKLKKTNIDFSVAEEPNRPRMVKKVVSLGVNKYVLEEPMVKREKKIDDENYAYKQAAKESMYTSMIIQQKEAEDKRAVHKMKEAAHPFEYVTVFNRPNPLLQSSCTGMFWSPMGIYTLSNCYIYPLAS